MAAKRKPKRKTAAKLGANGQVDLVMTSVDDPYEAGAQRQVVKNIRVHPIDTMMARGLLADPPKRRMFGGSSAQARFEAGQMLLGLFQRAEIGNLQAIDYSRAKVDTSYVHRGIEDDVMRATQELTRLRNEIGPRPFELLRGLIGERRTALGGDREYSFYQNQCVRDALDDLINVTSVARGPERAAIRSIALPARTVGPGNAG